MVGALGGVVVFRRADLARALGRPSVGAVAGHGARHGVGCAGDRVFVGQAALHGGAVAVCSIKVLCICGAVGASEGKHNLRIC